MERRELARLLGHSPAVAEAPADPVVIAERDPARFMEAFARAVAGRGPVFLTDPSWGEQERRELAAKIASGPPADPGGATAGRGWLMIPTGGTTGGLKFARHDEETLAAAVTGFCAHFHVQRVDWLGLLPLHHVSGLLAWIRTVLTGGVFTPWDWKRLEAGERPLHPGGSPWSCVSVVPTQLQRLLADPGATEWLRGFDAVFVGGGPTWPALLEAAARARIALSLSYGMTETAAMVAALRPAEFAAGERSCGQALPHAQLHLDERGCLAIEGPSLFRGYYPGWREPGPFVTEDLARWDPSGHLELLGRRDTVLITGGEKVDPAEVEAVLRATGEFSDVAVIGLPDPAWGQAVTACFPGDQPAPDPTRVAAALARLAAFKRPQRLVPVTPWPRNAQGKLNRAALERALAAPS